MNSAERIASLLRHLGDPEECRLSVEEIVTLIEQHLKCKGASRLPVLVVAAAYKAAAARLGERALPLKSALLHESARVTA